MTDLKVPQQEIVIPPWLVDICHRLDRNDPLLVHLNLNIRRMQNSVWVTNLWSALPSNHVLQTLNLTSCLSSLSLRNQISLPVCNGLSTLHLSYNNISDCTLLANSLQSRTTSSLRRLYLDYNQITDDTGGIALANTLRHFNTKLEELQLGSNRLGDSTALAMADMLFHNTSLGILNLSGNQISSLSIPWIVHSLEESNFTLMTCQVERNPGWEETDRITKQRLETFIEWNRHGRYYLRHGGTTSIRNEGEDAKIWSTLLSKITSATIMYLMLRNKPEFMTNVYS
jgi:hypothetical protein